MRLHVGVGWDESLAAGPDVTTLCVRARMDKRQICQCESEHV